MMRGYKKYSNNAGKDIEFAEKHRHIETLKYLLPCGKNLA